jgi:hypothetical protein
LGSDAPTVALLSFSLMLALQFLVSARLNPPRYVGRRTEKPR